MPDALLTQLVAFTTGALLLTAVLQTWRRSLPASVRLLVLQGLALAGLVATLGAREGHAEVLVMAAVLAGVKGVALPWALLRTARTTGETGEEPGDNHPVLGALAAAGLTMLAYAVSQPVVAAVRGLRAGAGEPTPWDEAAALAVPVGMALVLIGLAILLLRRTALSQLVGFLVLDNGISTIAVLTSGGLPLTVELGVLLDVLLVILILRVLAVRMRTETGATALDGLRELRD